MATPTYPSLAGKVALITGASSGIGRGCAVTLAQSGCQVALTGRSVEGLKETADQCQKAGLSKEKILEVPGDVSKDDDCTRIVESTVAHFGKLNILINNAGILVKGNLEQITMSEYDHQQNVNVRPMVLLSKLALPHLLKVKGNIVNVSSSLSMKPIPDYLAYNMSKAAVDHMTRTVALEVAGRGVRVNCVNPAVVVTEVLKRTGMSDDEYEKFLQYAKTIHPVGRVGEVEDISHVVAFLASDAASFVTGVTLPIDGGLTVT